MKRIMKLFTLLIALLSLVTLASCKKDVEATLVAETSRIDLSITFYVGFEDGSVFKEGATAYISLYEGEEHESTSQLTFTNNDYSEAEVKFTKLTPGVEYTGKLYYTQEGVKNFVTETKATIDSKGDSELNAISIETKEDFLNMANDLSAHYVLANDIDLTGDETAQSYNKISIFTSSKIFKGTFDGAGYTVKNFSLTSNTYMGLFGYTDGATIKNLKVENVTVDLSSNGRGETYMGALVGKAVNTTIENVTVKNVDFKFKAYSTAKVSLGGFAGRLDSTTVNNCSIEDVVIDVNYARMEMALGLFAGYNEGSSKITNCYSKGSVSACVYFKDGATTVDYVYVGGFIGISDSTEFISQCYTVADIKVTESSSQTSVSETHRLVVGGFVAGNRMGSLLVEDCLAVADLDVTTKYSNKSYVGGFAGRVIHSSSKIKNSAYEAMENGIKLDSKLEGVYASLLIAHIDTEKVEGVYAYTDKFVKPEGLTVVDVTVSTPDENLTNLKSKVDYR